MKDLKTSIYSMISKFDTFVNEKYDVISDDDYNIKNFKSKSLEEIMKQKISSNNTSSTIRKILSNNMRYFSKSRSKLLKDLVNDKSPNKVSNDILINKFPRNKISFKIYSEYILYALKHTTYKPEDKILYDQLHEDVTNSIDIGKVSLKNIKNDNFVKFLNAYRFFIFNFDVLEKCFEIMNKVNIKANDAENVVTKLLSEKGDKIVKTHVNQDIFQGIDISVIGKYPSYMKNDKGITTFQVKMAKKYNVAKYGIFINNTKLDLKDVLSKTKKFDYLVFVFDKQMLFIPKINITDVISVPTESFLVKLDDMTKYKIIDIE